MDSVIPTPQFHTRKTDWKWSPQLLLKTSLRIEFTLRLTAFQGMRCRMPHSPIPSVVLRTTAWIGSSATTTILRRDSISHTHLKPTVFLARYLEKEACCAPVDRYCTTVTVAIWL